MHNIIIKLQKLMSNIGNEKNNKNLSLGIVNNDILF